MVSPKEHRQSVGRETTVARGNVAIEKRKKTAFRRNSELLGGTILVGYGEVATVIGLGIFFGGSVTGILPMAGSVIVGSGVVALGVGAKLMVG